MIFGSATLSQHLGYNIYIHILYLERDVGVDIYSSPEKIVSQNVPYKSISPHDFRMSYPYRYELYKRVDESFGKEKYIILSTSSARPNIDEINDAFLGKPR